jgi:hypothetical protein
MYDLAREEAPAGNAEKAMEVLIAFTLAKVA